MTNADEQELEFKVTIQKNRKTGHVTYEKWKRSDGVSYCPTGPALRRWDGTNGELTSEEWRNERGDLHRDGDKPAWIHRRSRTGIVIFEAYRINGGEHRLTDAPTLIERDEDTGKVILEEYRVHNKLHRSGGLPAVIVTDIETDTVLSEEYWFHGYRQKRIDRDPVTGEITRVEHGPEKEAKAAPAPKPF